MKSLTSSVHLLKFLTLLICFFSFGQTAAQSISGFVLNEKNEPIPFVNIYIREIESGTSTDANGKYYLTILPGNYQLVVSAIGFETKELQVIIADKDLVKNIYLKSSDIALEEMIVKAKRKDPAIEIIQLAIKNRDKYRASVNSFKSEIYVKATEIIDKKERKRRQSLVTVQENNEEDNMNGFEQQQSSGEQSEKLKRINNISLMEVQLTLNYKAPDQYKEERSAYKIYGSKAGLFLPTYGKSDFNFYNNLVKMPELMEVPVISPISRTAILTYKFKLIETLVEDEKLVYKISVNPRKSGSSSVKGFIYINDGLWNINRLELSLDKGGLKFYDKFTILLDYEKQDNLWIQKRLEFKYETKQGKYKNFRGNTVINYQEFLPNYTFPSKFFNNEISITRKEAYKKDSSYWNSKRPEPLTKEEQELVHYKDSIFIVVNSKEYLDSLQERYNKITLAEVVAEGIGIVNNEKKSHLWLPPVLGLIGFEVIGGWRLSPSAGYIRRFENGKMINLWGSLSYGLKNADVQGNSNLWMRYDPKNLGDVSVAVGRSFHSINSFDAFLNQLRASNYILHDRIGVTHRRELFNGFFLTNSVNVTDRKSIRNYKTGTFLNRFNVIEDTEGIEFEDYRTLITETTISYTPAQKFITEPNRKIIIGSKFPTFSITHRKGWNGLLSSDIDFDYLAFAMKQDLIFGVLGNSKYKVIAGKFINKRDLRIVDIKRFRQSDPILYSDPLNSFQILDREINTSDFFLEFHHIHHFNGALVNNIPLFKKTRVRVVAGAGFLALPAENFRYQELFAGLERVFKLGARRRLRLGVYGAVAESNQSRPDANFKVSFDIIDTWKKDWSF